MRSRMVRRLLVVMILLLSFAALPAWNSYAQEPATDPAREPLLAVEEELPPPPSSPSLEQGGQRRVLVPVILTAPRVTIQLASAINEGSGTLINPTTTFSSGVTRIYADIRVTGGVNQRYRSEVIFPNGKVLKDPNITLRTSSYREVFWICQTTALRCGVGEQPLPRGTYQFHVYLNDQIYQQVSAVVR